MNKHTGILLFSVLISCLIMVNILHRKDECESTGGKLMKTLGNTYECVYRK